MGVRDIRYFTTFSYQCFMLADEILEWSSGGIFPLPFLDPSVGVEQNMFLGVE